MSDSLKRSGPIAAGSARAIVVTTDSLTGLVWAPPGAQVRGEIAGLGMERLRPYLDNGIQEIDNNAAERGMRAIALGRKNYLFVGSGAGGKAAANTYTLIETAKLNAVDPNAWLADTLARIPDYKITKVGDLLPWRWNG